MSVEQALRAVKKATGYDLEPDELQSLMDMYKSMTSSAIQHRISHYQKGEHGGDTVEKTAVIDDLRIVLAARQALGRTTMSGAVMGLEEGAEDWRREGLSGKDTLKVYISPKVLRKKPETDEEEESIEYEHVDVGRFLTRSFGFVDVYLSFDPVDLRYGISAWDQFQNEIGEWESPGHQKSNLFGNHRFELKDGSVIEFQIVKREPPPSPREWSPRMRKPMMGLDTTEERQHARAMAAQMLALGREGAPVVRAEARGYLRAIRDLAVDEGAIDLAREMERFLKELK